MESYLSEILRKIFLSQKVKEEIAQQVRQSLNKKVEQGSTIEQAMEKLGSPAAVAELYNQNYRKSRKKKLSFFNKLIALLIAFMVLTVAWGIRTLYNYAQLQAQWYQYQLYQYGTGSSTNDLPSVVENGSGEKRLVAPPEQTAAVDTFVNPVKIDTPALVVGGISFIVCIWGIQEISKMKREVRSGKFYFKPSMETQ